MKKTTKKLALTRIATTALGSTAGALNPITIEACPAPSNNCPSRDYTCGGGCTANEDTRILCTQIICV